MAEPISFPSTSTRIGLPLLFVGQAQKEFTVNQSLSIIDSFLGSVVQASIGDPPSDPSDGDSYRITSPSSGDWSGHEGELALWIAGAWHFIQPTSGLSVFDQAEGQLVHFQLDWTSAIEPSPATSGAVVDSEARQMLDQLVEALRNIGVFPQ